MITSCKADNKTKDTAVSEVVTSEKDTISITPQNKENNNLIEQIESTSEKDTIPTIPKNNDLIKQIEGFYIFPDSDKKAILNEDLYILDDFTLRLAKNEIFARKGYIFKDIVLQQYFSNMLWYKTDSTQKGTFDELSEIEQKNFNLINDYINISSITDFLYNDYINLDRSTDFSYIDMYEKSNKDGKTCYIQKINKDLNNDGILEKISVYFYDNYYSQVFGDYSNLDKCEIEITDINGKIYSQQFGNDNIIPCLKFADFDVNDNLVQFYIKADGPSGDPNTQIYSFDGKQIIKNIHMDGYITRYDGNAKLYSFDDYNVNCYYDLNKGLIPLPKENIVGTTIKRGNIQLFSKPKTGYTAVITSSFLTEPDYKYEGKFTDYYIGVVPENTPLLVTDIEFIYTEYNPYEYYVVPWLKVKTPQNIEGWFCLIHGD